jgi:hypothetical protein
MIRKELESKNGHDLPAPSGNEPKWFATLISSLDLKNTAPEHRVNLAFDGLGMVFFLASVFAFDNPLTIFCIVFIGMLIITALCIRGTKKKSG